VNGIVAAPGMVVGMGDELSTGPESELVVVTGEDALLLRNDSRLRIEPTRGAALYALRLVAGALLLVFKPGQPKRVVTATATIGIRGTGAYVAVERDRTYVCVCYGVADLMPVDDAGAAETVHTRHHDEPRYIYRKGMPSMMEVAPVVNHTDEELVMLEALVGRRPPFEGKY
jgi:hypothetical protein